MKDLIVLSKDKLWLWIALVAGLEVSIYLWAIFTASLDGDNYFSLAPEFLFDKCARNSGRVSAALILAALLMVGYYGMKAIYADEKKKDTFRVLMTLFTLNHLVHFLFLYLCLQSHGLSFDLDAPLSVGNNLHGLVTFVFIVILPFMLWYYQALNRWLYWFIIAHLFNVSCFINKTFLGKIKPEHPAYHNQMGIVLITAACLYILYRLFREMWRVDFKN